MFFSWDRSTVIISILAGTLFLGFGVFPGTASSASTNDRLNDIEQQLFEIRQIRENLAEQTAAVGRLQEEMAQLRGTLEELRYQLQRGNPSGSLPSNIEARLARIEATLGLSPLPGSGTASGGPVTTLGGGQAPAGTLPTGPRATTPMAPLTEEGAFNQAKNLYKQGKMEEARAMFLKFVSDFPASNNVPSAKFWVGETFYYQKRFEESVLEYQRVIQDHPKSHKVPAAMLKQAFAFAEIKDGTSARVILKRLIKTYPKTQQAVIAKKKLALIKNK